MALIVDGVLALTKSVPQLDGTIARSGHDLTVISRECDRQHILGVSYETSGGVSSVKIPETKGVIPGGRKCKLAIEGKHDVRYEMTVSSKRLLRVAIGQSLIDFSVEIPHDDGFVAGSGEDDVSGSVLIGGVDGCGNGGDPSRMPSKISSQCQTFSHDG